MRHPWIMGRVHVLWDIHESCTRAMMWQKIWAFKIRLPHLFQELLSIWTAKTSGTAILNETNIQYWNGRGARGYITIYSHKYSLFDYDKFDSELLCMTHMLLLCMTHIWLRALMHDSHIWLTYLTQSTYVRPICDSVHVCMTYLWLSARIHGSFVTQRTHSWLIFDSAN